MNSPVKVQITLTDAWKMCPEAVVCMCFASTATEGVIYNPKAIMMAFSKCYTKLYCMRQQNPLFTTEFLCICSMYVILTVKRAPVLLEHTLSGVRHLTSS
jgi:hypothetical protein